MKRFKWEKRLCACLLAALLAFGCLPANAMALDEETRVLAKHLQLDGSAEFTEMEFPSTVDYKLNPRSLRPVSRDGDIANLYVSSTDMDAEASEFGVPYLLDESGNTWYLQKINVANYIPNSAGYGADKVSNPESKPAIDEDTILNAADSDSYTYDLSQIGDMEPLTTGSGSRYFIWYGWTTTPPDEWKDGPKETYQVQYEFELPEGTKDLFPIYYNEDEDATFVVPDDGGDPTNIKNKAEALSQTVVEGRRFSVAEDFHSNLNTGEYESFLVFDMDNLETAYYYFDGWTAKGDETETAYETRESITADPSLVDPDIENTITFQAHWVKIPDLTEAELKAAKGTLPLDVFNFGEGPRQYILTTQWTSTDANEDMYGYKTGDPVVLSGDETISYGVSAYALSVITGNYGSQGQNYQDDFATFTFHVLVDPNLEFAEVADGQVTLTFSAAPRNNYEYAPVTLESTNIDGAVITRESEGVYTITFAPEDVQRAADDRMNMTFTAQWNGVDDWMGGPQNVANTDSTAPMTIGGLTFKLKEGVIQPDGTIPEIATTANITANIQERYKTFHIREYYETARQLLRRYDEWQEEFGGSDGNPVAYVHALQFMNYKLKDYDLSADATSTLKANTVRAYGGSVVVTPADMTIYMGGDGGYDAVVDAGGNPVTSNSSLPHPIFQVTAPAGIEPEDLIFTNADSRNSWKLVPDGGDYYHFEAVGGTTTPVRVQYRDGNRVVTDDAFRPGEENEVYTTYEISIYTGDTSGSVTAAVEGGASYMVTTGTGTLTVRAVESQDPPSAIVSAVPDAPVPAGSATAVVPAGGTTYTLNDTGVKLPPDAAPSLLFDDIIQSDGRGEARITELKEAADAKLGGADPNRRYEIKYLDLVDYNNGNAWITASPGIDIYWGYPQGTDRNTAFTLLHFQGLHRDTSDGGSTGFDPADIADTEVVPVEIERLDNGIKFHVKAGGFSPFVLVYEEASAAEYHTVTFVDRGSTYATRQVLDGSTVSRPSDPTRSNYRFEGWYLNSSRYDFGTAVTRDITLEARWTRIDDGGSETPDYAILRFESNGGTRFDDIERDNPFNYNPYDNIPTRSGYRFTGWYRDSSLRNRLDDEDLRVTWGITTVYAGWAETSVPSMLNGSDHYAYIQGYSDGSVRPEANITRAQVATIFFRLLDEDVRDDNLTTYNTFPDVNEDYWANTAISTMASLGVINGRNNGNFDPNAYITRAEFAAICARFDDSDVTGVSTFTDIASHWAKDEIERAAALGWVQGYADGTFRPNAYITRAQAVTMINRVLNRLPEDADDLLSGMNVWTDCQEGDWYYLAIQEATNSHDFETKNRVYETWTDLNSDPDWSRYEN